MHSTNGKSIEEDVIEALRGILREEFDQVIDSFIRNTQRNIGLLEMALAQGDRVAVIMTSHKLSSGAGQVGLAELSGLAHELENKAGHAPALEMEIIYKEIVQAFERAQTGLREMIASSHPQSGHRG